MSSDTPVDVIVPIYGAPDHVSRCVESVLTNTRHTMFNLVLSDDASPQAEIGSLLDTYAADERVVIRRSEQNRGFVVNCNESMRSSESDVVLLNSDTVVPRGWLRRLQRYAYLLDRVGSVTPLSNNAEVCSAPEWFRANSYPGRVELGDLDGAAAASATHAPIELPTAVGFCMYLRRDALNEVGLFDETAFGRGYGEENDLSCRMRHAGYVNLLADGVFVEHAGGESFGETGELHANLEKLNRRWPGYHGVVAAYRDADPLRGIRSRLGLHLTANGRDPTAIRPLYLLHYRTRIGKKGGTEYHTQDLIDGAGADLDPLVLAYEGGRPLAQWDADGAGMTFPAATSRDDQASGNWIDRLFDSGVDLVHIQHPKGVPLTDLERLAASARERGLPLVWSLHDYFAACPCIQMRHTDGVWCPTLSGEDCPVCDDLSIAEAGVSLPTRHRRYRSLIRSADHLITPSASAAALQQRLMGLDQAPTVIPHGVPGTFAPVEPPKRSRPLLVVLGYSAPQKGAAMAVDLVKTLGNEVNWIFLGRRHLEGLRRRGNVEFRGEYDRSELQSTLTQIAPDAIVLLSNWPETYLYTLSEAWRSGIPVFGTDLGAMSERIRSSGAGVLLDPDDPVGAAASIRATLSSSHEMASLRSRALSAGDALPTVETMTATYLTLYRELVNDNRRDPKVTHEPPETDEWGGWIGSFPTPFPTDEARPLRVGDRGH